MSSTIHVPLGVLDHFCPPNYTAAGWYIPLKNGVTYEEAFAALQDGLRLTFQQYPWLSGKVFKQACSTAGSRPGQLEIRYNTSDIEDGDLPQFRFNEISDEDEDHMSHDDIRECGFPLDAFPDKDVLWGDYINAPKENKGAECFKAQANFMPGVVFLCGAAHHNVCDGTAQFEIWRRWAENCKALQSGTAAETPDPLSSDRELIERIWATEGNGIGGKENNNEIPPVSWTLLDMDRPGAEPRPKPSPLSCHETMQSAVFYIGPDKFAALHKRCMQGPEGGEGCGGGGGRGRISGNDVLTALIWRGLLKARRIAALRAGRVSEADLAGVEARLQLTLDGRPDISRAGSLPLVYLGNLVFMNICTLPLDELTAPSLSPTDNRLAHVARHIRDVADGATADAMLGAYGLARRADNLTSLGLRLAPLRQWDMMLSSLIMFPVGEVRWGGRVFARQGQPEAFRPLWDEINSVARLCFPLPRKSGAGAEFVINLFEDEMELLLEDKEFGEFAVYVSS